MSDELAAPEMATPAPTEAPDPQIALSAYMNGPGNAKYFRLVLAILGSIPWVGSVIAASAALHAEHEQGKANLLMYRWLEEHESAYRRLEQTVAKMVGRIEEIGEAAQERANEDSYLGLVRRGFRVWDEASTDEKRDYVRRTLTNAAGTKLCSDDVVRIFIQWIALYDELHFRTIRAIYRAPGSTRSEIWNELHGEAVREDSAEADLFKLIIRDLSTGSVIRQHRDTTHDGRFVAHARPRGRRPASAVLGSAFDDEKPYELTELGSQFVHYALNEPVPRLGL